jgi:hypothetical protein
MNAKQIISAILISATLSGVGGYIGGSVSKQEQIKDLEQKVEVLNNNKRMLKHENYQLHLDLIKRDNPYKWELFGDGYGSWGYRRPDESSILGATQQNYIYLETE